MKTFRTKAIVLRRTNFGEADRIVQVLTPERGKVSVIARGVRREKSKLAGGIELFARCDITMIEGKGELDVLTGSRLEVFYQNIMTDYDRLTFAYETIKQIAKAADALDEPAFFDLLDQVLANLNDFDTDLTLTRIWFWLQLSILLGNGLNLSTDSIGARLREDQRYHYDELQSVFEQRENGRFTTDHIKLLRLLSGQSPRVVMNVKGISALLEDCLWLAERALAH